MKNIISRIWLIALIIVSGACSPEDGEQGLPGQDANVIISPWYDVTFNENPTMSSFFVFETNSDLTEEVLQNALVIVYGKTNMEDDGGIITALPYSTQSKTYFSIINENQLTIIARSDDGIPRLFDEFDQVRYIIIPATNLIEQSINSELIYEEVINRFDILD